MKNSYTKKIIAIIATYDREDLLLNRSILSISRQELCPDCIVIVNDTEKKISKECVEDLKELVENKIELVFLDNIRTKGASGAWNTGIIYTGKNYDINNSFIAILDDDDEWESNHIQVCSKYMNSADMIISGIKKIKEEQIILSDIPTVLNQSDFLVGNPGIQGSNIFISLKTMYEVGMFDENLLSSTDRDLCIRLCEINTTVISTNTYSVKHYEDRDRIRLSTPGMKKSKGLLSFWNKYNGRMTGQEQIKFLERAKELFNFVLNEEIIPKKEIKLDINDCTPFPLVIGIISGSYKQIKPLLLDLKRISNIKCIKSIEVIVMHNGGDEKKLKNLIISMQDNNLSCLFIDEEQRTIDFENENLNNTNAINDGKLPIGKARSILQKYIGTYVEDIEDCIVWLLDDDMRLEAKVEQYLTWLPKFRKEGVDVLIGSYEGGSPNPSTNAVRVQLHDLLHNLKFLNNMKDNDIFPDKEDENNILRLKYPDYYYDLSRKHFGHLESPFWVNKIKDNETVGEVRKRILNNVNKILTGEPFFRPLKVSLPINPILDAKDSANRGGTTFILNTKVLKRTPNTIIEIKGKESRRSDMIWAIINKYYYSYKIKFVNFSIYHDRNNSLIPEIDFEKTMGEIRGSAIYAGLSEILSKKDKINFHFNDKEVSEMIDKVSQYLESRLELYKQNFYRIRGLSKSLEEFNQNNELSVFLTYINNWFTQDNLDKFNLIAREMNFNELELFFKSLRQQIDDYSKIEVNVAFLFDQRLND